ncbi:hypothetical protein SDC9_192971 [bioreactor metagenome]|uniref:Uncharacterized protein n=1 Tax=bioreactor metagenome TaxID=1076179 RepID=A0A645IAP9_9ZZZZ
MALSVVLILFISCASFPLFLIRKASSSSWVGAAYAILQLTSSPALSFSKVRLANKFSCQECTAANGCLGTSSTTVRTCSFLQAFKNNSTVLMISGWPLSLAASLFSSFRPGCLSLAGCCSSSLAAGGFSPLGRSSWKETMLPFFIFLT